MRGPIEFKSWSISNGVKAFEAMASLRKLLSIKVEKCEITHPFNMKSFEKWFEGINDELL